MTTLTTTAWNEHALPHDDPAEMLVSAEKADWALLCMVCCVAAVTLGLAAASALFA